MENQVENRVFIVNFSTWFCSLLKFSGVNSSGETLYRLSRSFRKARLLKFIQYSGFLIEFSHSKIIYTSFVHERYSSLK